jgi:hypothetical protein
MAIPPAQGGGLLVFDAGGYVGSANHRSFRDAKPAAEQWQIPPALFI